MYLQDALHIEQKGVVVDEDLHLDTMKDSLKNVSIKPTLLVRTFA